jgi:hypothetical protein
MPEVCDKQGPRTLNGNGKNNNSNNNNHESVFGFRITGKKNQCVGKWKILESKSVFFNIF